jgi:hypothetical protein
MTTHLAVTTSDDAALKAAREHALFKGAAQHGHHEPFERYWTAWVEQNDRAVLSALKTNKHTNHYI